MSVSASVGVNFGSRTSMRRTKEAATGDSDGGRGGGVLDEAMWNSAEICERERERERECECECECGVLDEAMWNSAGICVCECEYHLGGEVRPGRLSGECECECECVCECEYHLGGEVRPGR